MNWNKMIRTGRVVAACLKVLGRGFARMTVGALTAGMMALSVYGYIMIPKEGGYAAVGEFVVATAMLLLALVVMYAMGGKEKAVRR